MKFFWEMHKSDIFFRQTLLGFGNRSFAPSALNPHYPPQRKNPRPISPPKQKILEPPLGNCPSWEEELSGGNCPGEVSGELSRGEMSGPPLNVCKWTPNSYHF